tara:strand:+ start:853 stop:1095 length:243 start_codon:yes stop_codon:yes gene_type:complete
MIIETNIIIEINILKLINSLKFFIIINPIQTDGKQKIKKYFINFKSIFCFVLKLELIKIKLLRLEIIDMGNKKNIVSKIE